MRMCIAALREWKVDSTLVHELDVGVAPCQVKMVSADRRGRKETGLQIRACQSPLPVAKILPAGLKSIEMTAADSLMGFSVRNHQNIHTRVLVSLKHALRRCGVRVPELDTTVLGP